MSTIDGRPVYVVGAGFSRAIHAGMPLTDELGAAIRSQVDVDLPPLGEGTTFEDWLTLLSTPLPFVEGYENTARRSCAERVTAAIAVELERRANDSSNAPLPIWLAQLVALWHAERAVVITFNYDTLIERAVTSKPLVLDFQSDSPPSGIRGSQVVYPAPVAPVTPLFGDVSQPTGKSFQLLKLHGSLNWYWAQGDGGTLVREHDRAGFGQPVDNADSDLSGTRTLDRFLIPPVTSKDSYYNVSLIHMLWRSARSAVKAASRLTIIGYSMPAGDRIAAELLRELPSGAPVDIVNYDVGVADHPDSPLGRAARLGLDVQRSWSGQSAVAEYTQERVEAAALAIRCEVDLQSEPHRSVIVSLSRGIDGLGRYAALYGDEGEIPVAVTLPWPEVFHSEMPPHELAQQQMPSGTTQFLSFFTAARLANATLPLICEDGQDSYVAIGLDEKKLERWSVVRLRLAPIQR